jgi:hypothetical protein
MGPQCNQAKNKKMYCRCVLLELLESTLQKSVKIERREREVSTQLPQRGVKLGISPDYSCQQSGLLFYFH